MNQKNFRPHEQDHAGSVHGICAGDRHSSCDLQDGIFQSLQAFHVHVQDDDADLNLLIVKRISGKSSPDSNSLLVSPRVTQGSFEFTRQ